MEMLLKNGADPDLAPAMQDGRTTLAAAAGAGNVETVKALLESGANVNTPASYSGRTALQAAAEVGHGRIVEILLNKRADVNAPGGPGHGRTALTAAAGAGKTAVVHMLLKAQANVDSNEVEEYGHRTLEEVAGAGELGLVEMWLKGFRPVTKSGLRPLEAVVLNGHAEIVEHLLWVGARATVTPVAVAEMDAQHFEFTEQVTARGQGILRVGDRNVGPVCPPLGR